MKPSTKLVALVPAAQTIGQGLVRLCLLGLLALFGAGVTHSHSASAQQVGTQIAATEGDIHIHS
jgi:hypothetical protein